MSAIEAAFARCRAERRAAFIPYLTAGDPDLATTARLLEALNDTVDDNRFAVPALLRAGV